ncbi:rudimentary-like [Rhodnius prolixus]|uniref:Uridine 5'-monophosphate synthase n=2 Tax=Rhodnius TaxID=13248 RepID=R4FNI1_RHOPR
MEELCVQLCEIGALKFGDFKMKVGVNSPVYFDLRIITSFPSLMEELSKIVREHSQKLGINYNLICGVPYTALPIATLLSVMSNVPMVVRRKEPKNYGTMKIIEGVYNEGQTCLIIEDVVTSGGSILETAKDLRKDGLIVTDVVVVIDREQGGAHNLIKSGIKMHSIFTLSKILEVLLRLGKLDQETVEKIKKYIEENQIFPDGKHIPKVSNFSRLTMEYQDRISLASCEASRKLLSLIEKKQTNLCVAVDVTSSSEVLKIVELVGPYVCMIKTHYDAVTDWSEEVESSLKDAAVKHKFLIMEDRKFGDIGNTVKLQTKKVFSWASFITMHSVAGPSALLGAQEALKNLASECGIVLVSQLSSKNNLITHHYTKATTDLGSDFKKIVAGFVCQDHSSFSDPGFLQFTPGVAVKTGGDSLGQQYSTPEDAVMNKGADVVIVGRAIYQSLDPSKTAEEFKEKLWNAYKQRISQ